MACSRSYLRETLCVPDTPGGTPNSPVVVLTEIDEAGTIIGAPLYYQNGAVFAGDTSEIGHCCCEGSDGDSLFTFAPVDGAAVTITHTPASGAPVTTGTIACSDNGNGTVDILGCTVSAEATRVFCQDGSLRVTRNNLTTGVITSTFQGASPVTVDVVVPASQRTVDTLPVGFTFDQSPFVNVTVPPHGGRVSLFSEWGATMGTAANPTYAGNVGIVPQYTLDGGATWQNFVSAGSDFLSAPAAGQTLLGEFAHTDNAESPLLAAGVYQFAVRRRVAFNTQGGATDEIVFSNSTGRATVYEMVCA